MLADVPQCGPRGIYGEGGPRIDIAVGSNFVVIIRDINNDAGDGVEGRQGTFLASREFFVSRQLRRPFEDVVVKDE